MRLKRRNECKTKCFSTVTVVFTQRSSVKKAGENEEVKCLNTNRIVFLITSVVVVVFPPNTRNTKFHCHGKIV